MLCADKQRGLIVQIQTRIHFLNILRGAPRGKFNRVQHGAHRVQVTFTWELWFGCAPIYPSERQTEWEGETQRGEDIFISLKSETTPLGLFGKLEMLGTLGIFLL